MTRPIPSRTRIITLFLILSLAIFAGWLLLASRPKSDMTTPTSHIPFQTLSKGDAYTAELPEPAMFVAGNHTETTPFAKWLYENDPVLQQVDFDRSLVLAISAGRKGSSGYGITVRAITASTSTVNVLIHLDEPDPGQFVSDVISYPYHIVELDKDDIALQTSLSWVAHLQDGTPITRTRYP